jgi:hypothetical protein
MKLNKKHFALKVLNGDDCSVFPPEYISTHHLEKVRRFTVKQSKSKVDVFTLSKTFIEAVVEASPVVLQAWEDEKINIDKEIRWCLMYKTLSGMEEAVFVELKPLNSCISGRIMTLNSKSHVDFYMDLSEDTEKNSPYFIRTDGFSLHSHLANTPNETRGLFHAGWQRIISCVLYMKYGDITTKNVALGKTEVFPSLKIDNKIHRKITAVDSTWLTNLVRDKSFKVNGHFRLQRVGKNLSEVKLTWVKQHLKKGYRRAASRWREMPSE